MGYFGTDPTEIMFNVLVHIIGVVAFILLLRLINIIDSEKDKSWRLLFIAFIVFVVKKIIVGLQGTGIIYVPSTLFNVVIVSIFIYALLLEIESRKKGNTVDEIDRLNDSIKKINTKI